MKLLKTSLQLLLCMIALRINGGQAGCDPPGSICSSHESCCEPSKNSGHYRRCVAPDFDEWRRHRGKCAWVKEFSRSKYDFVYVGTDTCRRDGAPCKWQTDCCGCERGDDCCRWRRGPSTDQYECYEPGWDKINKYAKYNNTKNIVKM